MYSPCSSRRSFIKACAAFAVLSAASSSRIASPAFGQETPKAKLVGKDGKPIKVGTLVQDENYVFLYPYISTACLLLRLEKPTEHDIERIGDNAAAYKWPGGTGKGHDVVAYSAICAHALTGNGKQTSFLTYNKGQNKITGHESVITCCAHAAIYDPAAGGKVISGPAPFPLAAVELLHDAESDELTAVGFMGSQLFDRFFASQKEDLIAEFGRGGYKEFVGGQTTVLPMKEFSKDIVQC